MPEGNGWVNSLLLLPRTIQLMTPLDAVELKQNIADSRHLLEQQQEKKSVHEHGTAREHQESLNLLGLTEQEALEYVIMLSREDNNPNSGGEASMSHDSPPLVPSIHQDPLEAEEGVFGWDIDDAPSIKDQRSESDPTSTSGSSSSSHESDDAQLLDFSPVPLLNPSDEIHFPPISLSRSPIDNPALGSRSPPQLDITTSRSSAWGKDRVTSLQGSHSTTSVVSFPVSQRRVPTVSSHLTSSGPEADDDLEIAIQLSLAEARSRGDQI